MKIIFIEIVKNQLQKATYACLLESLMILKSRKLISIGFKKL